MADDGELASESEGSRRIAFPHVVCRRLSSSSESGFNSDLSDEHNASPSSVTDDAVQTLNGLVRLRSHGHECESGFAFTHRITHRMRPPQGDWLGLWSQ